MFHSCLPIRYWGESILTGANLINRLPSPGLNWKSLYQTLFDRKPDYLFIKTFGCLCYATNIKPHNTKFELRAYRCADTRNSLG